MDRFFCKALSPILALSGALLVLGLGSLGVEGAAGRSEAFLCTAPPTSISEGDAGAKLDPDGFRIHMPDDLRTVLGSFD